MSLLLKYFDFYTSAGMEIIPVYEKTKTPIGRGWNRRWRRDWCRSVFERGNCNMGILLGDIVDVEGDTDTANEMLNKLIGGIPHPSFRSSRSVHHLFQSPDPNLTATRFKNIEFRGRGVQSVIPPSVHEDGVEYFWLKGSIFPPPPMPVPLYQYYFSHKPKKKKKSPGLRTTVCGECGGKTVIHRKRLLLEVRVMGGVWRCHRCRERDVRQECREVRQRLHS